MAVCGAGSSDARKTGERQEFMPHPTWHHYCTACRADVWLGRELCSECGVRGDFDGWRFGMIEQMAAYQRRTGFKPIGAHGTLVALLLTSLLRQCDCCGGRGLVDATSDHWRTCPECDGLGDMWTVGDGFVEATRRRIAAEYPDAVALAK
jgi:hypothetical protein